MNEEPHEHSCDEYGDDLAELALGILTGRARTAALAHVDSCPRCAEELEQLARAADAVVQVAPAIDPPVGFEVRLFSRMGVDEVAVRRQTRRLSRFPNRWLLASAAAVLALGLGLGLGLTGGGPKAPAKVAVTPPGGGTLVSSVSLRESGHGVGRVFTYAGSTPWMFMTLTDSSARGRVICEIVTDQGVTHRVGAFTAKDGYGAWGAPLPVAPQDVRSAEVVTPGGAVVATASFT
jgi:hypothetical protein